MVVRVFYPNVFIKFVHIRAIQPYRAGQSKLLPPPMVLVVVVVVCVYLYVCAVCVLI